jgi:pimeloyl-ACP methyl ester carboxylesterase
MVPCFVEGVRAPARCGTVRVFEDRERAAGRTLDLQVVVIPALAATPAADPVFFLAGGPGQAASQIAGFSLGVADRLHDKHDFVLVDQRGTGRSHPLFCDVPADDAPLAERFDSGFDEASVDLCRAEQDADLRMYTTAIAVEDLDAVRAALGYEKIDLWGTSYGTRVGLAYLRAHGEHTRAVVLDSVAPMSLYLPLSLAKDAERALARTLADCAAEPTCAAAFPDLGGRLRAFVDQLDREPLRTTVRHPVTGASEDVVMGRAAFVGGLRGLLYATDVAALVPLALDRAIKGDLGPFVAMTHSLSGGVERQMATGMFLSVVCSEDVPFFRTEDLERDAAGTIFEADAGMEIVRACTHWPRAEVPRSFREPVESDVPVLLLSGDLDPVTPPSWAEDAKKTLHRSASVVLSGTGHTAAVSACARKIAAAFVESGSEVDLDAKCAGKSPRPPFFTTFAGTP